MYLGPGGQLLVPAPGLGSSRHHRSNSAAGGGQLPQVVINNTQWDEHQRRPRSSHGHAILRDEWDEHSHSPIRRERSRSRSRVRSRTPSPYHHYDYETEKRLKKLEDLEKREKEEEQRKKLETELIIKKAKEEAEKAAQKKEEEALRKKAIEEYNIKQKEKEEKEKAAKKKADEEFRERLRKTLSANGYSDDQIEHMVKKAEGKGDKGKGKSEDHGTVLALRRPTYIKVHRKHLEPDTLDIYQLPWEYDAKDTSYLIIKQWIPEHDQDILFEHTRKLRESRLLTHTTTELRREKDQLMLVRRHPTRKKSPARANWFLT
ncbi:hypothetical protein MMC24_000342 [Lignoscripta atroalba]|nr:hypothetical protein [Lignoscripta atroalba]